jgi:hypothetical protein
LRITVLAYVKGCLADAGQLPGDAPHHRPGLVTFLRRAQPQLGGDHAGPPTRRAAPVTDSSSRGATGGFDLRRVARNGADALGQQPGIGCVGHIGFRHRGVDPDPGGGQQFRLDRLDQ